MSDGAVLLHLGREVYFGLNAVGALIWQGLPPVCSDVGNLCATIQQKYPDVDPQVLHADIAALLTQLQDNHLVTPAH